MLVLAILLSLQLCAMAAVVPVLIKLESDPTNHLSTYTVPLDKVLIIDAINYEGSGMIEILSTNGATLSISMSSGQGFYQTFVSLNRGIKISGGTLLRAPLNTAGSPNVRSVSVYGSIVDASDLYANAKPSISGFTPLISQGIITMTANVGREAIIRIERSGNIVNGDWEPLSTFATGISAEQTIALSDTESSHDFYRLKTLSR